MSGFPRHCADERHLACLLRAKYWSCSPSILTFFLQGAIIISSTPAGPTPNALLIWLLKSVRFIARRKDGEEDELSCCSVVADVFINLVPLFVCSRKKEKLVLE